MLVPKEPKFTAEVSQGAVIPEGNVPVAGLPAGLAEKDLDPESLKTVRSLVTVATRNVIMDEQKLQQDMRVKDRCSTEQWLDENEREWYAMDEMLRSRPWATRKDEVFKYPFRETTNEMRKVEGPWLGDDIDPPAERQWTRSPSVLCEPCVHFRGVAEHPPLRRVMIFTPEFGSEKSFDAALWKKLQPVASCDMWIISWQGWTDFDEMIQQMKYKVLSFADATSTVWVGHSTGAIVAYEMLKIFEKYHSPNLPTALLVSGCPAPHLFSEKFRPFEKLAWLGQLQTEADFAVLTPEQIKELECQFQVSRLHEVDAFTLTALERGVAPGKVKEKFSGKAELSSTQKQMILNDLKVIKSYQFRHADAKAAVIPVLAMGHDEDPLVSPESIQAWGEYSVPGKFEYVALEDLAEDSDLLVEQGHGFLYRPVPEVFGKLGEICDTFQLVKEADSMLPDPGPTNGEMPEEIDCLIIGAGIAGVTQGKALAESGRSVVLVDRYRTLGGIWMFYANNFSRVNSSEPAYRIVNQEGPSSRPNEDHSPRHDILRDIFTVANKYLYGKVRCNKDVQKVTKRADGTYDVAVKDLLTGKVTNTHAKVISIHVNRRIGKRRDVTWPNRNAFRGEEVYGYANEVVPLNFWGKRVIVVGAGAFAFENLRTALEHGAKHCTILGRRSGTTCPKWIDMIAFLRPVNDFWATNPVGSSHSFECWKSCYDSAGLDTPECWEQGLLKPHNHTVSVSDLAFIGGYHGMVGLKVGEIKRFRDDGYGVELISGEHMDADIIIKATGFHLNDEVPNLTGRSKIHGIGLLDMNMHYGAEPLLDGGQFGGSKKGKMEWDAEEVDQQALAEGYQAVAQLNLPLGLKANPFGSAYVGGMLVSAYHFRWLVENAEYQKAFMESAGDPVQSCVETWASQVGTNLHHAITKIMARASGRFS